MKSRFDEHLSRKLFHIFSGTLIAYLFINLFTRVQSVVLVAVAFLFFGSLDLLRLRYPSLNRVVIKVFGPLMRSEEKDKPSAQFFYILGLAFVVLFMPKAIAIQAILTLAWMDPIASIFGIRFGNKTWVKAMGGFFPILKAMPTSVGAKTIEGSFAGFMAAFLAGIVAWTSYGAAVPTPLGLVWPEPYVVAFLSLVGATAATIAEAWPTQWDDNVNIPVWTSIAVWAGVKLIGQLLVF